MILFKYQNIYLFNAMNISNVNEFPSLRQIRHSSTGAKTWRR